MKWCLLVAIALVSSKGNVVNTDKLWYVGEEDGKAIIYQYYNPYVIYSDWTRDRVIESIVDSLQIHHTKKRQRLGTYDHKAIQKHKKSLIDKRLR